MVKEKSSISGSAGISHTAHFHLVDDNNKKSFESCSIYNFFFSLPPLGRIFFFLRRPVIYTIYNTQRRSPRAVCVRAVI